LSVVAWDIDFFFHYLYTMSFETWSLLNSGFVIWKSCCYDGMSYFSGLNSEDTFFMGNIDARDGI